jgi:lactate dehydrogenase-like 2-hydroxyacid dehydrogenase
MNKPKVFITRRWPASVEEKLRNLYDVTLNETDRPLTADEFKAALQQYDAVCPTVCDSFPTEVLNVEDKRCKILANFGVGYNHIDIPAAKANELIVTNSRKVRLILP